MPGSTAAPTSYEMRVPMQKGRPDISSRGVKYFRVDKPVAAEAPVSAPAAPTAQ